MIHWLLRLLRGEDGFGRISTGAAMVIALGGGLGAYYVATQGGAPAGTANLWIDTNGGTCTRQSPAGDYIDAQACSAFSTAYSAASSADTIRIKNGSYSSQTVSAGTKTLTFIGESLSGVVLSGLTMTGSNSTVDTFSVDGSVSMNGSSSTITNFDVDNGNVGVPSTNATVSHGDIGPTHGCPVGSGPEDGIHQWSGSTLTGLHVDDVVIHNLTGYTECDQHMDAIQTSGCTNCIIENSQFYNTNTSHILIKDGTTDGIIIRNNVFGVVDIAGNSIDIEDSTCTDINITNNTFYTSQPNFHDNGGCTSEVVRNNYFVTGSSPCGAGSGASFDYNVFQSAGDSCGSHTKTCTATWSAGGSPTNADPNINSSDTCILDAGDPANYASPDRNGITRPQGSAPDASANEIG